MRPHLPILLLLAITACARPSGGPPAPAEAGVDSIVLQRGPCGGYCPVYRLSLARSGAVVFHARERGNTGRIRKGAIAPEAFQALAREAAGTGFWELPDRIERSAFCTELATDQPHAWVTLHAGGRAKTVDDYQGCRPGPKPLRDLEERIDSVAGVRRWLRPEERRMLRR